ncbi:hypothetical protein ACFY0P_14730 [Streptomyces sp. NPDC001714]|uniref:hypothetical protein n=1 Tax=Streptomyces sp. NPDC001714 TaxID=3364603 RepID=UPI003686B82B
MDTVSLPDTWAYALRLPHDPRAARVARMTVRAALSGHGRLEVHDVAEIEKRADELVRAGAAFYLDGASCQEAGPKGTVAHVPGGFFLYT